MRHFKQSTLSLAAAQALMVMALPAMAQQAPAAAASAPGKAQQLETVVVSGQRAALQSAQRIKQNSDEIVDSIVADDIGKLPDRSVSEVLQRIVGVTMDRVMARSDPGRFSVEGSGVLIRGLTYVSSQLNGRESFSANGGRGLSFEDVPPELMAGVDVYKNPSAEQIEGAIGGLVNLRTALPFDYNGFKAGLGVSVTKNQLADSTKPTVSGLLSNTWNTDLGRIGLLVHAANSKSSTRTDGMFVDPYFLEVEPWPGKSDGDGNQYYRAKPGNHWFPKALGWRSLAYDRKRQGTYVAGQWKKDNLEASLTHFRSKYNFYWDESSIDSQADPYTSIVSDAKWGANGALLTGTITDPGHNGIPFNANTRFSKRNSVTKETAFNIVWTPTPALRISNDFQFIESTTNSFDSTVATGINMPKETVDLSGDMPRLVLDATDKAYLADPSKYYWGFTMEHLDKSRATQKAWKGDIKYSFDHPVLQDLRVGLRLTDRDTNNQVSNPSYNWKAVTQSWQSAEFDPGARDQSWDWHPIRSLAYLSRFGGETQVKNFNNFMNGKNQVASLVLPKMAVAANYPDSYKTLHSYYNTLCTEYALQKNPTATPNCPASWEPIPFDESSPNSNKQHETTKTAYAQLRFGFEEWNVPVDGNVGLRVVNTDYNTTGTRSLTYTATTVGTGDLQGTLPTFTNYLQPVAIDNKYTDVLPSMNLRWKFNDKMQLRFAFAKALARADFSDLQPNLQLLAGSATLRTVVTPAAGATPESRTIFIDDYKNRGTALGNPLLKPVKSDQFDLSAEWYIDKTSSITLAAFNKRLKDVIVNQTGIVQAADTTGRNWDFAYSTKVNGAKGWARGIEFSAQHYFNGLPGLLNGLGVQGNFTYVDSRQTRYDSVGSEWCSSTADGTNLNLFVNGCDTNAQSYGALPLPNLSRKAYNLAILYEHGPISARVAYAWRGKYLNGVAFPDNTGPNQTNGLNANPNSPQFGRNNMPLGLPVWTADFGQLDLGVQYRFTDKLTFAFEGQNLTDAIYKQLMQQHIGMMGRSWFASGPRYTLSARLTY